MSCVGRSREMAAIPFLKQNSVCDSDGLRGKTPVSVLFQAFCAQLDMFSLICLQTSGTRGHVQNEMSSHLFKNVLFVFFFSSSPESEAAKYVSFIPPFFFFFFLNFPPDPLWRLPSLKQWARHFLINSLFDLPRKISPAALLAYLAQIIFQAWWYEARGPHRVSSFFPLIKINWQQILSHERRMDACCPYARYILICLVLLLLRLPVLLMAIKRSSVWVFFFCCCLFFFLRALRSPREPCEVSPVRRWTWSP